MRLVSSGDLLHQHLYNNSVTRNLSYKYRYICSSGIKVPFLVSFRSSPPLETKLSAIEMFDSLLSSSCSSARAMVPAPFCSLALSVAAPLKAALVNFELE